MGHQILSVALNTGNLSNLEKMLKGEGWVAEDVVDEDITIDNPALQAVLAHMTKSDWQLVQQIWDQIDVLFPKMAEVHKRTSGLELAKVDAVEIETPYGTFNGGYYPLKYDENRSIRSEEIQQESEAFAESAFSPSGIFQPSATTGAKIQRTKYFAPIRFSLDVVPNHIDEVIQYISHYEAIRQVYKITHDQDIRTAIKQKVGKAEFDQIRPWLNDIARDGKEAPAKQMWDPLLRKLRFGTTLGMMGFKASTGLMQISGLSNTVGELGLRHTMRGMRQVVSALGTPTQAKQMWQFVTDRSKIMRDRIKTMDRELYNALKEIQGKSGILAMTQEVSMRHIAYIQTYLVDLPTWYGAYYKGLDEAKAELDAEDFDSYKQYNAAVERQAVRRADFTVENVQGSGMTKDLAKIMRNQGETGRMLTMFYSFFSSMWNMQRDTIRGGKSGQYNAANIAAKLMFIYAVPVAYEMILRGEVDLEDEEWMEDYLTRLALYPAQTVPVVRDMVNALGTDFDFNLSPIQSILAKGLESSRRLAQAIKDGEDIEAASLSTLKNFSKLIGAVVGAPGITQAWSTGEHIYDVLQEGDELTTQELLFGPERE
jgi:hypothetical protein